MDLLEEILQSNPELTETEDEDVRVAVGTPPGEGTRVEKLEGLLDIAKEHAEARGDRRSLRDRFRRDGAEALGRYVTFRLRPDDYGVYLRADALLELADEVHRVLNRYVGQPLLRMDPTFVEEFMMKRAMEVALGHFNFHHTTDVTAARVEIPIDRSLYFPYVKKVYLPGLAEGNCLEEQCANVASVEPYYDYQHMMERLAELDTMLAADDAITVKALFTGARFASEVVLMLKDQPSAYSGFTSLMGREYHVGATSHMVVDCTVEPEKWREAKALLARQVAQAEREPLPSEEAFWTDESPPEAPVYLI